MKSKLYLKDKLKYIHDKFPNLSIKYQYDLYTKNHIVEVSPLLDFKNNQEYIDIETNLSFDFDNLFFPESILFISENSLTKISNPEYSFEPSIILSDITINPQVSISGIFEKTLQYMPIPSLNSSIQENIHPQNMEIDECYIEEYLYLAA